MTIGERLRDATHALTPVTETPRLDAEILVAHALGISRAKLLAELREPYPPCDFEALLDRRLNHEPIAYILGEWEFFSLPFACRAPILVPRPETEHLVEIALDYAKHSPVTHVVDLCTGTGCVAIALARHLPEAQVCAVDLNPDAVALAMENAARNRVALEILQGDCFQPVATRTDFDIIVANPPYVAEGEWAHLPEVIRRHEDPLALLSGTDGLDLVRRIARESPTRLKLGGLLAMEIGDEQGDEATSILRAHGFTHVQMTKDLAGHDRIVSGIL